MKLVLNSKQPKFGVNTKHETITGGALFVESAKLKHGRDSSMIASPQLSIGSSALNRWKSMNSDKNSGVDVKSAADHDIMEDYDFHMMRMGKKMSKVYPTNIYKLNRVSHKNGSLDPV
jgi:hypothetical protein